MSPLSDANFHIRGRVTQKTAARTFVHFNVTPGKIRHLRCLLFVWGVRGICALRVCVPSVPCCRARVIRLPRRTCKRRR